MYEPIFKTEVKPVDDFMPGIKLVSLQGLHPGNWEDKLTSLGLVPVKRAEYEILINRINEAEKGFGYDVLVCMGELLMLELNRMSCLAFHKSTATPGSGKMWEMQIFCTYHTYFYSCEEFRTREADEPEERRWIVVKALSS